MLTGGVVRGRAKSRQSPLTHIHRKVGRFLSKFQNRQAQFQKRVLLNSKTWKKRWTLGIHRKVGRFFGKSHNTWGLSFSKWLWKRSIVKYGVFFKNLNCPTRGPEIALRQGVAVTQCTKKLLSCPLCAGSHSQEKPTTASHQHPLQARGCYIKNNLWRCHCHLAGALEPLVGPEFAKVHPKLVLADHKLALLTPWLALSLPKWSVLWILIKKWGPPQLFLKPPACPELTKAGPKLVLVDYDLFLYWR